MRARLRPDTIEQWELALLRTTLAGGLVLLAAQVATRVLLPDDVVRQSVEECLRGLALPACVYLLGCSVVAWVRGSRALCGISGALCILALSQNSHYRQAQYQKRAHPDGRRALLKTGFHHYCGPFSIRRSSNLLRFITK